ncbi:MAG: DUF1800 family protein, partial [Bacteroidota bacterium]
HEATGQYPLNSPSVFNFFLPDYQPNGIIMDMGLFGPVFQIHNSTTAINYINEVAVWAGERSPIDIDFWEIDVEDPDNPGEPLILVEEEAELPLIKLTRMAKNPARLIDHLDLLFTHGQLSPESRQIILDGLQELDTREDRLSHALYFMLISPDYAVLN